MDLFRYIVDAHSAFRKCFQRNEGLSPVESWFCYWSKDYTDNGNAFLSFYYTSHDLWPTFRPHPYVIRYGPTIPADKIAQHLGIERNVAARDRVNCSLMLCALIEQELQEVGTPPAPITRVLVAEDEQERTRGLQMQIHFEHNIYHQPWEEGSPGYDT